MSIKNSIWRLHNAGKSIKQIAYLLDIPEDVVHDEIIYRWADDDYRHNVLGVKA